MGEQESGIVDPKDIGAVDGPVPPPDYADMIRRERENRGQTRQDLAHHTRISICFIEALEERRLDALPGDVFGRGFIRNICKALETDSVPIVEAFDQACRDRGDKACRPSYRPTSGMSPITKPNRLNRSAGKVSKDRLKVAVPTWIKGWSLTRRSLLLAAPAGFALLVASIWMLRQDIEWSKNQKPASRSAGQDYSQTLAPQSDQVSTKTRADRSDQPVQKATENGPPSASASASQEVPSDPPSVALPPRPHGGTEGSSASNGAATVPGSSVPSALQVLSLTVLEKVNISVKLDNSKVQELELLPDTYQWKFSNQAEITLTDAASARIQFNGMDLGVLGKKGQSRRMAFYGGKNNESIF